MITHPKYPNGNIYLSGGMQFAKEEGSEWRLEISKQLKKLNYFPLDICELDRAYADSYGHFLREINTEDHLQKKSNIRKHFVETDLNLIINDSDGVILYYDESARRGAGTISEAMIAYQHDIPIFLVSAYEDWDNEVPGWLQALSTKMFNTFDELLTYFIKLPPKIMKRDIYGNRHSGPYYLCSLSGEVFEKNNMHYVSKVSPLYSKRSVEIVKTTHESHVDRYKFILAHLENQARIEMLENEYEQFKEEV